MASPQIDKQTTSEIVREFGARAEMLVQILQAIVMRHGWIPEDIIRQLADELNLSRADVYGVVNFYHDFRTQAPAITSLRSARPKRVKRWAVAS